VASSFFFLVFAWYGQSGWAVANLHPGRSCGAIALVVSVTAGIAGGGLWVSGQTCRRLR